MEWRFKSRFLRDSSRLQENETGHRFIKAISLCMSCYNKLLWGNSKQLSQRAYYCLLSSHWCNHSNLIMPTRSICVLWRETRHDTTRHDTMRHDMRQDAMTKRRHWWNLDNIVCRVFVWFNMMTESCAQLLSVAGDNNNNNWGRLIKSYHHSVIVMVKITARAITIRFAPSCKECWTRREFPVRWELFNYCIATCKSPIRY